MSNLRTTSPETEPLAAAQGVLMGQILNTIARVAVSDLSVRIVGENGTGKQWLARVIHAMSSRADREFVPLDCSTIAAGQFHRHVFGTETAGAAGREVRPGVLESAIGGTVYFDKFSVLPLESWKELVVAFERQHFRRVGGVEDVYFNVRAIEGLSVPVDESHLRTGAGGWSSVRLGQVGINLPPLRERRESIPYLVGGFITECNASGRSSIEGITPEALELCTLFDWPGNVRELRSAIESAALVCRKGWIDRDHVSPYLKNRSLDVPEALSQVQFGL